MNFSAKQQVVIAMLISFTFYFCWSFAVNSQVSHNFELIFRSALIQGIYSALMTGYLTQLIQWAIKQFKCIKQPLMALLPVIMLQTIIVIFINWVNQTPDLLNTILPSIIFSSSYAVIYAKRLLTIAKYQCKQA